VDFGRYCAYAITYSDGAYINPYFCSAGRPQDPALWVYSYYDDVIAQGKANGSLSGWYDATWTNYPLVCPRLHFHTQLRRVTG
jgi:hypothetical protein